MARSKQSAQNEVRRREAWKKRQYPASPDTRANSNFFDGGHSGAIFDTESLGLPKMSEQILQLLDPLMPKKVGAPGQRLELLAMLGIAAWNVSVSPESIRDEMLRDLMHTLVPNLEAPLQRTPDNPDWEDIHPTVAMMMGIVQELIERKLKMFPDDLRYVVRHRLERNSAGASLQIACSLPPQMTEEINRRL